MMKRSVEVALLVALITSLAFGQMANQQPKAGHRKARVEEILIQMEVDGKEATARKDAATLDKLIADDWVGQSSNGVQTKAQVLDGLKSGDDKFDAIILGDMKVRVLGNTAVVTGSQDVKSSYQGKDTSGQYLWMDVFVKCQGHWQNIFSQTTPIAKK